MLSVLETEASRERSHTGCRSHAEIPRSRRRNRLPRGALEIKVTLKVRLIFESLWCVGLLSTSELECTAWGRLGNDRLSCSVQLFSWCLKQARPLPSLTAASRSTRGRCGLLTLHSTSLARDRAWVFPWEMIFRASQSFWDPANTKCLQIKKFSNQEIQ